MFVELRVNSGMSKILIILSLLTLNQSKAEETAFKHKDLIIGVWDAYIDAVDKKEIQEMFRYFHLPTILHFDESDPVVIESEESFTEIFNVWKDSPQANFHHTERESITVNEIIENFSCVADVVYKRLDKENNLISRARSLYHFVYKDERWKIYMISNVDADQDL